MRAAGASDEWVNGAWARVIHTPISVRKGMKDLREDAPRLEERRTLREQGVSQSAMVFFYHPKEYPDGPKCSPTELKDRGTVGTQHGIWD